MTEPMDPNQELLALRARTAEVEARVKLGRDLTPGTGPDGELTRADLAGMKADEINARWNTGLKEALANLKGNR